MPRVGDLVGLSLKLYKERFKTLAIISLIPSFVLLVGFLSTYVHPAIGGVTFFVLFLVSLYLMLLLSPIALYYVIARPAGTLSMKESFKKAKPKVWRYFAAGFLAGLFAVLGFIALIIPGIIISLWYALAEIVVLDQDVDAWGALKESKRIATGRLWGVFVRLVVMALAIAAPFFLTGIIMILTGTDPGVIEIVNQGLIAPLTTPFAIAYLYALYLGMKGDPRYTELQAAR